MKKIRLLLTITILLPVFVYTYAQAEDLIVEGNTYLATEGGNVCIGTTTPAQILTVNGHIDMLKGQTSQIHSLGEISFDCTPITAPGRFDEPQILGIQSRNEGGNWNDDLRINSPADVITTIDSNNNNTDSYFQIQHHSSSDGEDLFWVRSSGDSNYNGNAYFKNNLGIGTTTPTKRLHVGGDVEFDTTLDVGVTLQSGGTLGTSCGIFGTASGSGIVGHGTDAIHGAGLAGVMLVSSARSQLTGGVTGSGINIGALGIATGAGGEGVRGEATASTGRGVVAYASHSSGTNQAIVAETGYTGGWAGTFYGKMQCNNGFSGTARESSAMYLLDIAENINIRDCSEGDVVTVDLEDDATVTKSKEPYQSSIAGVISTSPLFYIGDEDIKDGKPLALAGRVPCKVTVENGPIKRGDVLVSSSKPGYAMRADLNKVKTGMIIGRALEPLEEGEGKILILVK